MFYKSLFFFLITTQFSWSQNLSFTNVSVESGLDYIHQFSTPTPPMSHIVGGGSATGDIDNDGFLDLFFILGNEQNGVMMHNQGNGTFSEIEGFIGNNEFPFYGSGPLFFDYNQDEYIDLIVGSHFRKPPVIFVNNGNLTFTKTELPEFEILNLKNTLTITSMDYNLDGYQDLFMSHWLEEFEADHIWKNNGDGSYTNVDSLLRFYNPYDTPDYIHATNFTDINGDGFPDLLASSDFGTSQIWINKEGQYFELDTINILTDENGMGGTVADFDNDGDMDWYTTNIYDDDGIIEGNWGTTGNKLYVNNGTGIFTQEATEKGVQNTDWGWGTSFSDFDNDGYLDIIATNGWPNNNDQFVNDHTKLFLSQDAEYFTEVSEQIGMLDSLQGRGLSVFDYDLDGDLDVFITNMNGAVSLWRNNLENENSYLNITLTEPEINRMALGAKVTVHTEELQQIREIRCGSNYTSQDPMNAHFGLGLSEKVDSILIQWQDGSEQKQYDVAVNQHMNIKKLSVGVTDKNRENRESKLFPNPSSGNVSIQFENRNDIQQPFCIIVNNQGQQIEKIDKYDLNNGYITFEYNTNNSLTPGIYYAQLVNGYMKVSSISFVTQ